MMLFKVITITLITICAADNQKLLPQPENEQEVISPMNYKNIKSDGYTTPSSKLRPLRAAPGPPNAFQRLQYAPLHIYAQQKKNAATVTVTSTTDSIPELTETTELYLENKSRISFGKSHLEPREEVPDKKCYASELSSVSRSPGLNAVYREISESLNEKPSGRKQTNDDARPYGVNQNLKSLTTTFTPLIDLNSKANDIPLSLANPNRLFILNPIKTVIPIQQSKTKRQYAPLNKYHRLHLNIARVYSPGQVIVPNSYSGNNDRIAAQAYPDLSQENIGYPVNPRHHVGYHLRFK